MAHHDPGAEVGRRRRAPAVLLGAAVLLLAARLAGSALGAVGLAAGLGLFVAPGLAWASRRWLGDRGERLCAGAALGYFASSLAASVLYRLGRFEAGPLAALVLALAAAALVGARRRRGAAAEPGEDGGWGLAAALVAVAIVAVPFLRVGAPTPEGEAYRAYFSADLMTHLSVTAELSRRDVPPQDPFYAGASLGYYWLFFQFPALAGETLGRRPALLLTALAGAVLFTLTALATLRLVAPTSRLAFVALLGGVVGASFEGLAILLRAAATGGSWTAFRSLNVDAVSRWILELVSLDGLHRSLLYTPQHLFSYTLLLLLVGLVLRERLVGPRAAALAGMLLAGMAGASIVTAMIAGPWWALVRLARGGPFRSLARDGLVAGAVAGLALAWYVDLGFFSGAGASLTLRTPRLTELVALVGLEAGGVALLAAPALLERRLRPVVGLAALALLAVLVLDVRGYEGVWMAWRAGSVFLLALMVLAARGAARWPRPLLVTVLVAAAPTALMDVYNAQDVANRELSPGGFRWTTVVGPDEREALDWLEASTPARAVVQWDVRARPPEDWAVLPALGARRMAVGFPLFLLDPTKYRRRERRHVRPIFASGDAARAHRLARRLGIDYVWIGRDELAVRGERARVFWEAPELFRPAFANRAVTIFRVVP